MIRALWFMIKVGVLVALALWLVEQPGYVAVSWQEYNVRAHVSALVLLIVGIVLLSIFIYNVIRAFVDFPKSYRRYLEIKNQEKGYRALTIGLAAVAAGDTKNAVYQAHRAAKLMKEEQGLGLLLKAQAARLDGREEDAQEAFTALLDDKDAAFLGVRGLLQTALDEGDHEAALVLAERALKVNPKQPWILKMVYDLELRQRLWGSAEKTRQRLMKSADSEKQNLGRDRVAILHAQADEFLQQEQRKEALKLVKKAYKYDAEFVPTIVRLAKLYLQDGSRKKAENLIRKAWKLQTHPEFSSMWGSLMPVPKRKKPMSKMGWLEKLLAVRDDTADAQMAAARLAMEEGLWGEARMYLKKAEGLEKSAALYELFAQLEEKADENYEAATIWREQAEEARQSPVWRCRETGRIYPHWSPVAEPHGSFNTIEWVLPDELVALEGLGVSYSRMREAVLEAPKTSS